MPCIYTTRKEKPSQAHIDVAKEIIEYYGGPGEFSKKIGWARNYIHGWARGQYFLPFYRAEHVQNLSNGKWTVLDIRPDLKLLKKYFENA